MVCQSQELEYCAYSHFAEMLSRAKREWLIAMFELYFDDSGTDAQSDIAIAACYVSTINGWKRFVNEWIELASKKILRAFTWQSSWPSVTKAMNRFAIGDAKKKKVYKKLASVINDNKRVGIAIAVPKKVYKKLASVINNNKRVGIAIAVPKKVYDDLVPDRIRKYHGDDHYSFAVIKCLQLLANWRKESLITHPTQIILIGKKPRAGSEKQ